MARQLDVKWDTAWLMKQKLLEMMLQRNSMYKLAGDIQVDDAYQGGEKAGKPEPERIETLQRVDMHSMGN